MEHVTAYSTMAAYFVLMIAMGAVFKRFNSNTSDYFRSGCQGTWWLVGTSFFMAGISGFTFTASAGVAFEAGWTVLTIYAAGAIAGLVQAVFLAHRFRQTRVITFPELIRERFGPRTEQFYAVSQMFLFLFVAGIWLWGISIFVSQVFGFDIRLVTVSVGLVVLLYATAGGSWAVMAGDVIQGLLMFALALLLAGLALGKLGGVEAMFSRISALGLTDDFAIFAERGRNPGDTYTVAWSVGLLTYTLVMNASLFGPQKFFAVKDGFNARLSALVGVTLMVLGALVFFVPPVAARLLWADEVMASEISKPAEAAYAVASRNLLPPTLLGLMVVAMFSATMSSMDTGLNGNAALVVRNVLPAVCRTLGRPLPSERAQFAVGHVLTIIFGLLIIGIALGYNLLKDIGMFEVRLAMDSLLLLPLAVPMMLGLLFARTPGWSCVASIIAGWVPAATAWIMGTFFDRPWPFHYIVFAVVPVSMIAFFATTPFWERTSEQEKRRILGFFARMRTPVDFEAEVGEANDHLQLRMIGAFAMIVGFAASLLLLIPASAQDRYSVLFVAGFIGIVGGLMYWRGTVLHRRRPGAAFRPGTATATGPK